MSSRNQEDKASGWLKRALHRENIMVFEQDMELKYTRIFNPHPVFGGKTCRGKADEDFLPDHFARQLTLYKQRVLERAVPLVQDVVLIGEDQEFHCRISLEPLFDEQGNVRGLSGSSRDITRQKQIENELLDADQSNRQAWDALLEKEERLRIALDAAGFGTFDYYPLKELLVWDEGMRKLWNIAPEEDVSFESALARIHPDDRERVEQVLANAVSPEGSGFYQMEYRVMMPSGGIQWHETIGRVYFEKQNGNTLPVRMAGIEGNITARKKAEDALREQERLTAVNHELEAFSYSVSHDLRNPLLVIDSFSRFLLEDYKECLDEEGIDYLQRIGENVLKMQRLIDNLLSLSRIDRQEMQKQMISLDELVRTIARELQDLDPDRNTKFAIQENVMAHADANLMQLAFENLLRNAWKFTSRKEFCRIEFGSMQREGKTIYMLRDNGEGFDNRAARQIFEPFHRGHKDSEFEGSGVGLSIVKRVIGRHGGRIWAEGQPGQGACFYFTL